MRKASSLSHEVQSPSFWADVPMKELVSDGGKEILLGFFSCLLVKGIRFTSNWLEGMLVVVSCETKVCS